MNDTYYNWWMRRHKARATEMCYWMLGGFCFCAGSVGLLAVSRIFL